VFTQPDTNPKCIQQLRDGTSSGFLTRDPTRLLSVVKQILDNGLIAVSVTCQETQTV